MDRGRFVAHVNLHFLPDVEINFSVQEGENSKITQETQIKHQVTVKRRSSIVPPAMHAKMTTKHNIYNNAARKFGRILISCWGGQATYFFKYLGYVISKEEIGFRFVIRWF